MLRNPVVGVLLGWAIIVGCCLLNMWIFSRWLGLSYVSWYLNNGAVIGLVSALIALAWGDVNRHVGLISAHPLDYIGSCLQLAGLPLVEIGAHLAGNGPASGFRTHFDRTLASGLAVLLFAALVLWIVVVVPIQYFIYLLCGAPGRVFAASRRRVAANLSENRLQTRTMDAGEKLPEGWWEASLASKPVTATGIFAALLLTAAKLAATA